MKKDRKKRYFSDEGQTSFSRTSRSTNHLFLLSVLCALGSRKGWLLVSLPTTLSRYGRELVATNSLESTYVMIILFGIYFYLY